MIVGSDSDTVSAWMTERDEVWDANSPHDMTCPAWCTDTRRHDWDPCAANGYVYRRTHAVVDVSHAYLQRADYRAMSEHVGSDAFEVIVSVNELAESTDQDEIETLAVELMTVAYRLRIAQREF